MSQITHLRALGLVFVIKSALDQLMSDTLVANIQPPAPETHAHPPVMSGI